MSIAKRTLIIGDLSGIQDYLFDVANEGGQQARRWRARSFFIQLSAECLALRVMKAAGCSKDKLLFCGAGKFIIETDSLSDEQQANLAAERKRMNEWLLGEANGQLRFAVTTEESNEAPQQLYAKATQSLQREKLRPFEATALTQNRWQPDSLILKQLDTPCALCERRSGTVNEFDQDENKTRLVCRRCHEDLKLGKNPPKENNWIALRESGAGSFHLPGWNVSLHQEKPASGYDWLIHLTTSAADVESAEPQVIKRALNRHIPKNADDHPIEFGQLAEKAEGDNLLAVLKADADSLGQYFNRQLNNASDFIPLKQASREMDTFFGITLYSELEHHDWDSIYTVFAGGDDLLLVGPWDVIFDFAAHANEMFKQQFGKRGLTISAGLSFLKPKQPIKRAAEQAEELLHQAKTIAAPRATQPKDQFAAFGQIWKWSDHQAITDNAKQLADWVKIGIAERGWLQTLLRLAEWRQLKDDPEAKPIERMIGAMATSRLSYFVARNFPKAKDSALEKRKLRQWADNLIADFDEPKSMETLYLPTIARYAITATRKLNSED